MNLNEKVEVAVRAYPHWSPAERERLDDIVEEVLSHCRSRNGNEFIWKWCDQNLPFLTKEVIRGDRPRW